MNLQWQDIRKLLLAVFLLLLSSLNNFFSKYPRHSEEKRLQNHLSGFHMERIVSDSNLYWNQDLPDNDNYLWT